MFGFTSQDGRHRGDTADGQYVEEVTTPLVNCVNQQSEILASWRELYRPIRGEDSKHTISLALSIQPIGSALARA